MVTLTNTAANRHKLVQAQSAWSELLAEALRRGFHGAAAVEVVVQDGTIQHIRRKLERVEK